MESAAAAAARQRKACIHCYQKKVRCDWLPQAAKCTRCTQNGLECVLPTETQKTSRPSMRSGFEDLSTRVRQLEDAVFLAQEPASSHVFGTSKSTETSGTTSSTGQGESPVAATKTPAVKAYRGETSPWVSLVNHVDTKPELDRQFQETATRLAEDERSSNFSTSAVSYDLLQAFPHLQRADVLHHITAYAIDAPYPILHYDSLMEITEQLLDTHRLARWGQIACILMYMTFGSTLITSEESTAELQRQAEVYLHAAWGIMPQLILDHDLWALKALTLMVHYLQASSKPEPCWTLLGSASRMAVSLGFHQKTRKVDTYTAIELEEGKRAWWLCVIMEKTFCTTFGYPSTSASFASPNENNRPEPFHSTGRASAHAVLDPNVIFGTNELDAVAFFNDMIDLTRLRDKILNSTALGTDQAPQSPEAISALLRSTLRDTAQGQFTPRPISARRLRASISDLAHYNAVQVIAVHLWPPLSNHSSTARTAAAASGVSARLLLPAEAVLSARASLQLILETRTKGTTMCLWMWLYYAFTASVVLFLHSVSDPLNEDAVLDLALLDELRALCEGLGTGSEGARRVREIVEGMGRVAWEVVKRAARRKKRGLEVEEEEEEEGEGRGGSGGRGGEVVGEGSRSKRIRSGGAGEGEREREGAGDQEGAGAGLGAQGAQEATGAATEILNLENVPQNFEWEQWDQWLEDAPFDVE